MKIAKIEIEKVGEGYRVNYHIQDSKMIMGRPEPMNAFDVVCNVTAQLREWENQRNVKEAPTAE